MKISIKEYMESKNISRRTIYNYIKNGQLETIKEKNKTYITKENFNQVNKKENTIINQIYSEELKNINSHIKYTIDSYEMLKNFDYEFIRLRLSTIEKTLIDFSLENDKNLLNLKEKNETFYNEIDLKLKKIEENNNNFLNNLLLVNEQNHKYFEKNLEIINKKLDLLIKKLTKDSDTKKTFSIFSKK